MCKEKGSNSFPNWKNLVRSSRESYRLQKESSPSLSPPPRSVRRCRHPSRILQGRAISTAVRIGLQNSRLAEDWFIESWMIKRPPLEALWSQMERWIERSICKRWRWMKRPEPAVGSRAKVRARRHKRYTRAALIQPIIAATDVITTKLKW